VNTQIEALIEGDEEGGWIVKAPRVGVYRGRPRAGGRRSSGDVIGRLTVLNRTEELMLPAGCDGLVTDLRIHDRAVAVEYGQPLFRLAPVTRTSTVAAAAHVPEADAGASLPAGCHAVACPIDGVFYHRAAPGAAPFVTTGEIVENGRTLGLIEAMKSFNAVAYGGPGLPSRAVIVETRAADAAEVRQGAVLFVVRAA
jgi:acetyl-CoA carboxylase biotin carboxyl carrier protein